VFWRKFLPPVDLLGALVELFCERPFYLNSGDKRLVDFWVRYKDHELLLVLDVEDQPRTIRLGATELELHCEREDRSGKRSRQWNYVQV
jgi:hypothetical protein